MGQFKEFVLEEGELFDALKHGVQVGLKAFREKRQEQAKEREPQALTKKILSAEGKDLESLVKKIVDNGYTIKGGQVVARPLKVGSADWLLECTNTRMASSYGSSKRGICRNYSNSNRKAGGGRIRL
jgi:hypothetical protein